MCNPPFHAGKYYFYVTNIAQMNADGSDRNDVFKSLFSSTAASGTRASTSRT